MWRTGSNAVHAGPDRRSLTAVMEVSPLQGFVALHDMCSSKVLCISPIWGATISILMMPIMPLLASGPASVTGFPIKSGCNWFESIWRPAKIDFRLVAARSTETGDGRQDAGPCAGRRGSIPQTATDLPQLEGVTDGGAGRPMWWIGR